MLDRQQTFRTELINNKNGGEAQNNINLSPLLITSRGGEGITPFAHVVLYYMGLTCSITILQLVCFICMLVFVYEYYLLHLLKLSKSKFTPTTCYQRFPCCSFYLKLCVTTFCNIFNVQ